METLKFKTSLSLASLILGLLFTAELRAAESNDPGNLAQKLQSVSAREVRKLMRQAQKSCPKLDCKDSRIQVQPLTEAELKNMGTPLRAELRKIARGLALDLWPDTVLEGPYHSVFRIRMDGIQRLTLDGNSLGFRLSFSDKAWNTDNCAASKAKKEASFSASILYRNCETGRIYDAGFVLNNMKTSFRDDSTHAEYRIDEESQKLQARGFFNAPSANSGITTLRIPGQSESCEKTDVEKHILANLRTVSDYIDEERGLYICDDGERDPDCYEESSLVTLMTQLEEEADHKSLQQDAAAALGQKIQDFKKPQFDLGTERKITPPPMQSSSFVTDSGYSLCDHNAACQIDFRVRCQDNNISVQER